MGRSSRLGIQSSLLVSTRFLFTHFSEIRPLPRIEAREGTGRGSCSLRSPLGTPTDHYTADRGQRSASCPRIQDSADALRCTSAAGWSSTSSSRQVRTPTAAADGCGCHLAVSHFRGSTGVRSSPATFHTSKCRTLLSPEAPPTLPRKVPTSTVWPFSTGQVVRFVYTER